MTPDELRARQQRLSDRTAKTVAGIIAARETAPRVEIVRAVAVVVQAARRAAETLASLFLRALTGRRVEVEPREDVTRLMRATESILDDDPAQVVHRMDRLARTEPAEAVRDGIASGARALGLQRLRVVNDPDPCDECRALAAQTHPIDRPPVLHPNCSCVVIPTTEDREEAP